MKPGLLTATAAALLGGCSSPTRLTLHHELQQILPKDVVRVETTLSVDSSADTRMFFADTPYHAVATGIGFEVRDFDGSGERKMRITFDATLGFQFTPTFDFTLLPPVTGAPPPLVIVSRAVGPVDTVGQAPMVKARFAGVTNLPITDVRCQGRTCSGASLCCANQCIDVSSDPKNCGMCDTSCAGIGDGCSAGLCRCQGGSACDAGRTCCRTLGCLDLMNDPFHCGDCMHACNPGETCIAGGCRCGTGGVCTGTTPLCCGDGTCSTTGTCDCMGTPCGAPRICCGSACIDPSSDNTNCGRCGTTCGAPKDCFSGDCGCEGTACASTDTCCTGIGCRNLQNDPSNCGACGHACSPGEVCALGKCQCGATACPAGKVCCGGACTFVDRDPSNCGACGRNCRPGEACAMLACSCAGAGGVACTGNQTCCTDGCFDLATSATHCGNCTINCGSGACIKGACMISACVPACTNGNTCTGSSCQCQGAAACTGIRTCCPTGCADLSTDDNNCGGCSHPCATGEMCKSGVCKRPDGFSCAAPGDCLSGNCVGSICCNSPCSAACMTCSLFGKLGTCSPTSAGTNDLRCVKRQPPTCGLDGTCNGNGACAYWPSGTKCLSSNCTNGQYRGSSLCNGTGACLTPPTVPCFPYTCAGSSACFTACSTRQQCAPPACAGDQLDDVRCTAGGGTVGMCVPFSTSCKPYTCLTNSVPQCATAPCNNGCLDRGICATGCSCKINIVTCALASFACSCP